MADFLEKSNPHVDAMFPINNQPCASCGRMIFGGSFSHLRMVTKRLSNEVIVPSSVRYICEDVS